MSEINGNEKKYSTHLLSVIKFLGLNSELMRFGCISL